MTSQVVVRPVKTARDLERFIAFPYDLFRGDPLWVPRLRLDVRKQLDRKRNPFFEHAEAEYFLAEYVDSADRRLDGSLTPRSAGPTNRRGRKGKVAGRIAAIHNRLHNEFHHDAVGFFGFFETVDDPSVSAALFDAAGAWLKARGLTVMRGPASFSSNDEYGLLVWGFDSPPTLLNPHNPQYYVRLVEGYGFTKAKDLWQYQYETHTPTVPERIVRGAQIVVERNHLRMRMLDLKRYGDEVEMIKRIYNKAWEQNWGFVPMTDAEIDHMAKDLKPIVVPQGVVFVHKEGIEDPIGFAVALPDYNVAFKKIPSGRIFPGILRFLWESRPGKISRGRILLLGILPEYRNSGAEVLLYKWIWEEGYKLGFRWGEAGWILEDNAAMNNGLKRIGFQHYKTLRVYDRPL